MLRRRLQQALELIFNPYTGVMRMTDKYVTLVFRCQNEDEFKEIGDLAKKELCRAWSLDHEIHRLGLIEDVLDSDSVDVRDEVQQILGLTNVVEVDNQEADA